MTRKELVRIIYFSDYCLNDKCRFTSKDECRECCSKALAEYENEVYNRALDDFKNEMHKFGEGMEDLERVANNLRKGDEE